MMNIKSRRALRMIVWYFRANRALNSLLLIPPIEAGFYFGYFTTEYVMYGG